MKYASKSELEALANSMVKGVLDKHTSEIESLVNKAVSGVKQIQSEQAREMLAIRKDHKSLDSVVALGARIPDIEERLESNVEKLSAIKKSIESSKKEILAEANKRVTAAVDNAKGAIQQTSKEAASQQAKFRGELNTALSALSSERTRSTKLMEKVLPRIDALYDAIVRAGGFSGKS